MNPVATSAKTSSIKISGNGSDHGWGRDGSSGQGKGKEADRFQVKQIGLWLFLLTVTMFFAAITSSLLIRRSSPDWKPIYFPSILWLNTLLLLLSSLTLSLSARALKKSWAAHRVWLGITALLGFAFLAGQLYAWRLLSIHGLFLPTNPHSSFFYLITCLHGLHLAGGILWITIANILPHHSGNVESRGQSMRLMATYWHFMDLLWVYLFVLLLVM